MGRGKRLSSEEISQIDILKKDGKNVVEIARLLKRSEKVCSNYLKLRENYGQNHPGAKGKLNGRTKRRLFKEISNKTISCAELKERLGLKVTRKTVYNAIKSNKNLKLKRLMRKPPLNAAHKQKRITWACDKVGWSEKWSNVIFSDEKSLI